MVNNNEKIILPFLAIVVLISISLISAADFSIGSVTKLTSDNPYRGDLVNYKGVITADSGNICRIECVYSVGSNSGSVSDSGFPPSTQLGSGKSQEFPFSIRAEGSSPVISNLVITCNRVANYINCWPGSATNQQQVSLSFLYPGDGICTTTKEKCNAYASFYKEDACSCPATMECRPDGNRNPDNKGCQTFCGNNICESNYEKCDTCEKDCKKCDLKDCSNGNECSGGYCVWGVCWHAPTRINDGHCDTGENCANSPSDCACQSNQRCSTTTNKCETFCGNGVCEDSEKGVCKADCKWCGDGSCDSDQKESCKNCETDCGVCENDKMNEEITNKTKTLIEEELKDSKQKEKIITYSAIGIIVFIIIVYIILKFVFSKKKQKAISTKINKDLIQPIENEIKNVEEKITETFKEGAEIIQKKESSEKSRKKIKKKK